MENYIRYFHIKKKKRIRSLVVLLLIFPIFITLRYTFDTKSSLISKDLNSTPTLSEQADKRVDEYDSNIRFDTDESISLDANSKPATLVKSEKVNDDAFKRNKKTEIMTNLSNSSDILAQGRSISGSNPRNTAPCVEVENIRVYESVYGNGLRWDWKISFKDSNGIGVTFTKVYKYYYLDGSWWEPWVNPSTIEINISPHGIATHSGAVMDSSHVSYIGRADFLYSGHDRNGNYVSGEVEFELLEPSGGNSMWSFTTDFAPDTPTIPTPSHGAFILNTSPTLSVNVSDPEGDSMNVSFYNASDNSLIGVDTVVGAGIASVSCSSLIKGKSYAWYTNASDGKSFAQSSTWIFTIMNSTIIDETDGIYDFEINTNTDDFSVHSSILVSDETLLMFASAGTNPLDTDLENGLLFINITVDDSNNLDGEINITIQFNPTMFKNIKIWWFNESAVEWQELEFTDLGGGLIEFSIDHLSIFALSGEKPLVVYTPDDDDDDDVDDIGVDVVVMVVVVVVIASIGAGIGVIYVLIQKRKN